jgi:hypothetical protein
MQNSRPTQTRIRSDSVLVEGFGGMVLWKNLMNMKEKKCFDKTKKL